MDAGISCGSAGVAVYNILQPEVTEKLGLQNMQNLLKDIVI